MATDFLAHVIGWYLVIFSLLTLFKYEHVKSVAADIVGKKGLFFVVAVITVILGLLMVTSHNLWVKDWPVIITVFAWLVLVSGLVRLFYPEGAYKMTMVLFNDRTTLSIVGVIILIIGLYLLSHVYAFHF